MEHTPSPSDLDPQMDSARPNHSEPLPRSTFGETEVPVSSGEPTSRQNVKVSLDKPIKLKRKHRIRRWIFGILMVIGAIMIGIGVYAYQFTKNNITDKTNQLGFFEQVHRIIDNDVEPLQGENEDRINVLLLGNGGEGHDGGALTDTIMVMSYKPSTNEVALISLPRDLTVPFYAEGSTYPEYRKINNAVYLGGIELAEEKIKDVTGLDVHYHLEVDFSAFRDIIDTLGGIDVTVDNAFTDYEYPDYNYGYQTITFKTGVQHMNGEKALQFARSRHGNNGEGSDFARAARQQKILEAVQTKLLSLSTLLNPTKIGGLLGDLGDHVSTDMEIWEMLRFAEIAKDIDRSKIINAVVGEGEGGLVYSTRSEETGASIVVPNAGYDDFSEIQDMALHVFEAATANPDAVNADALQAEAAVIDVQNGSSLNGLATTTAELLADNGLTIDATNIGNGLTKLNTTTVIYDVSGGANPLTAAVLEEYFDTTVVSASIPTNTNSSVRVASDVDSSRVDISTLPADVDFVILLGSDAATANANANTSQNGVN